MFMGKVDYDNTIQLLKIRKKECFGTKGICIILAVLFGVNQITLIRNLLTYQDEVKWFSINIYSFWGFILVICTTALHTINYKEYNQRIQIFPQSNKSRFTSYEIFCFSSFIKVQILTLALYFLQYGIVSTVDLINGNIGFAYQFSLPFVIAGFFVNMVYGFLAIAIIILFGALDRKFKWTFRISGIGLVIVGMTFPVAWNVIRNSVEVFTKESSILLFLIKAICLWILLVSVYHLINKFTKYHRVEKKSSYAFLGIVVPFVFILYLLILTPLAYRTQTSVSQGTEFVAESERIHSNEEAAIRIDVSNIPDNTKMKIKMEKVDRDNYNIIYGEGCTNPSNNNILIDFKPTEIKVNSIDVSLFTETKLEAKVVDDELYLDLNYNKNIKVVFLSPYTFMWQFDYFDGKQIFKEFIGSRSGSGHGRVIIYLPEGKDISVFDVYK